jgi:drug/metabolite transporter (DMT)-like permease
VTLATTRRPSTLGADLALAGAAFMFGSTFLVMQDAVAVDEVEVVPFLVLRFSFALLVLAPLAVRAGRPAPGLGRAGLMAGGALTAGYVLQTVGLQHTTTSVSAFLTYLLVVFVPLLSAVVARRPPTPATMAGVVVAVVGLVLLLAAAGAGGPIGLGFGEVLTLGCAVAFAAHILVLGDVAPRFDVVHLTTAQLAAVVGLLALPAVLGGGMSFPVEVWLAAAYTGFFATALAFGLQVWGQRRVSASRTALVLMLEPVFAAALGYATGERLGLLGLVGATVILGGIVVSEVGNARTGRALAPGGATPHP